MLNYPLLYLEHLSERDLELLARTADTGMPALRAHLAERPQAIDELLTSASLFDAIFYPSGVEIDPGVTPFLAFGALVNRSASDLRTASYVSEWSGPGRGLPVFDVEPLREFFEDGTRRFFLIEFMASFTKVASGSIWVRTRRGYRRRRFSELDPVRLAEMVDLLPPAQRAGGYRRLGDVALFLCGVFPDHTARHPLAVIERERLTLSAGLPVTDTLGDAHELSFLEEAGAGWYRRAVDAAVESVGVGPEFLRNVADRFTQARRILNYLADRYLHRLDSGMMRPSGPTS